MADTLIKRCIFHLPWKLRKDRPSASQLRPLKMLQAFREAGYEVSVVMGTTGERKRAIRAIMRQMAEGAIFDFCYSESSTGPTLLSNGWKGAVNAGFIDNRFLVSLKNKGIPIALFYRDIYWKFRPFPAWDLKKRITVRLHRWDLNFYNRTLTTLYLPSGRMAKWLPEITIPMKPLHPGCEIRPDRARRESSGDSPLRLVYVGGMGGEQQYGMNAVYQALNGLSDVRLSLSTRPGDWERFQKGYSGSYPDNIQVQFLSGEQLEPLYAEADVALLFLEPSEYFRFTMSYKLFEYLSWGLPVIAVKDTATGDFIERTGAGWVITHSVEEFRNLLERLKKDPAEIKRCREVARSCAEHETWKHRVEELALHLGSLRIGS